MEISKLPPQNIEAEQAILGAILIEKEAINKLLPIGILPTMFYKESNRLIFKACLNLHQKHDPIDLLTVSQALRAENNLDVVGGLKYLNFLTDFISSSANIIAHAMMVKESSTKRYIISETMKIMHRCFDPMEDVHDLNDSLQSAALQATQGLYTKKVKTLKTLITSSLAQIQVAMRNRIENKITGLPSGLRDLDNLTGGWQRGDLIILAARPSMGKSALAITFAQKALEINNSVGIVFSLEMSGEQNVNRMMSDLSKVKYSNMAKGEVTECDFMEIQDKAMNIYSDNIVIDDNSTITVMDMKAKATNLKLEMGRLDFIIADYMQLTKGMSKGNREQEIAGISRAMKEMARSLDVPVIALSQLSRKCEERSDKRPMLSDLRESGAIEQDADVVAFLYRPEYYGIAEEDGISTQNLVEMIFAKHRNGACLPIRLYADLSINKFANWDY